MLLSRPRPEFAAGGPVFSLDVADDDIDRVGLTTENLDADARNCFSQLFLLFNGPAFQHFNMVCGHCFLCAPGGDEAMIKELRIPDAMAAGA